MRIINALRASSRGIINGDTRANATETPHSASRMPADSTRMELFEMAELAPSAGSSSSPEASGASGTRRAVGADSIPDAPRVYASLLHYTVVGMPAEYKAPAVDAFRG